MGNIDTRDDDISPLSFLGNGPCRVGELSSRSRASGRSSIIDGGRDAVQIYNSPPLTPSPPASSSPAQYLCLATLVLILLCLSLQTVYFSDISKHEEKQSEIIGNIYSMRQEDRAEKRLEEAISRNSLKHSSPILSPTAQSNILN